MTRNTKLYRQLDSLTSSERHTLMMIRKPEDLKAARILTSWEDDHLLCYGIEVNGVQFGLWWANLETIAAYIYWESCAKARSDLVNHLITELNVTRDENGAPFI